MQLQEIRPIHKPKKQKRIGRGGKKGAYSGRGIKGQIARAGRKIKPVIRELIKKYPKLRGYRQKFRFQSPKLRTAILNLEVLEKKFNAGEKVTPEILLEKGIIRKIKGKTPLVKILGKGEISKALTVEGCRVSKNAEKKIEKAGGAISI